MSEYLPVEEAAAIFRECVRALPDEWDVVEAAADGATYTHRKLKLHVMFSVAKEKDGKRWIHVSASYRGRIPGWHELKLVKHAFLKDREALIKFPRESEYVNLHPHTLHLWSCYEGPVTPDFRTNGSI